MGSARPDNSFPDRSNCIYRSIAAAIKVCLLVTAMPALALADKLYLDEELNALLAKAGNFRLPDDCLPFTRVTDGFPSRIEVEIKCYPKHGVLTVTHPIDLIESNITLGSPIKSALPERFSADRIYLRNCTSSRQTLTGNMSLQAQVNQQITNSTQIQTSRSTSLSATFSINFTKTSAGQFAGSQQWQKQMSTTQAVATSEMETITKAYSVPIDVPPMTLIIMTGQWVGSEVQIPWAAKLTVDSNVSKNLSGKNRMSDVLSHDDRTFSTQGIIRGFSLNSVDVVYSELKLSSEHCNDTSESRKMSSFEVK